MNFQININYRCLLKDLHSLCKVAGPSHSIAKVSSNDPRIGMEKSFPIAKEIKRIIEMTNTIEKTDVQMIEHNGNIIIVGGLGEETTEKKIRNIPVTLMAHLDEITYYISKRQIEKQRILIPLCQPPTTIQNPDVKILGYRGEKDNRDLIEIGYGKITKKKYVIDKHDRTKNIPLDEYITTYQVKPNKNDELTYFLLNTNRKVLEGDLVIQDYGPTWMGDEYDVNTVFHSKALDDRVGSIASIYAIIELSKNHIPAKAILTGGEEGVPNDVSWDRLIRPSVNKYCNNDDIILICDGIDGNRLLEFGSQKKYIHEAVLIPYTANGKGPGDLGIFSLLRDEVAHFAKHEGFDVITSTDYVSRSTGPKIMDEYPFIGYINWVNGEIGDSLAVCHVNETVHPQQIINIIGTMVCAVKYFSK